MLIAAALGHEQLTAWKTAGVLLTIAGVGVALGEKALGQGGTGSNGWVQLPCSRAPLCGAVCSVLYRPYLRTYPALPVGAFAMLASVGFLAVLAFGEGFFNAAPRFTAGGWLAVLFIGFSSGVGYFLWLWALKHAPATRVAVFLSLSPITAMLLGGAVLGEPASPGALLGVAMVVAGLWAAHHQPAEGAA